MVSFYNKLQVITLIAYEYVISLSLLNMQVTVEVYYTVITISQWAKMSNI